MVRVAPFFDSRCSSLTTFTAMTDSTVSTVTTAPIAFTTGTLVNIHKSSSSTRHHLLCLHVAIYGDIVMPFHNTSYCLLDDGHDDMMTT